MTGDRRDVAGLFSGKQAPSDSVPDRTAGIPAPPTNARPAPDVEPVAAPAPTPSPSADPARSTARTTPKRAGEPERLTIPLAPGTYEQISNAAEDANLWIHEFLEVALNQHEDQLRAKDGIDRHRRRRGAPRLQNAQLRVTQGANKRLRQIASRHNAPLADVVRTLVAHALADVEAELDTQFDSSL